MSILLTSCVTTVKVNDTRYKFPDLEIETQSVDEEGNVYGRNKHNELVFYYDKLKDTVTITYDYWLNLIKYGIKTQGIENTFK